MSESLLAAAWVQVADNMLAIRRAGDWRRDAASFDVYVAKRWSISKTRAKMLCNFATFCSMARGEFLRIPDSPDNIKPILDVAKKRWMDSWRICLDHAGDQLINAEHCKATMEYYGMGVRHKVPPKVLKGQRIRRATKTIAGMEDGTELVNDVGVGGLGHDWDVAMEVMIDADQAKMNDK